MTETMKAREARREECPDVTGIVRRGEAAERVRRCAEQHGEHLTCFVGYSGSSFGCEAAATMEVYGLPMCEEHGEKAAGGALEELAVHIEWESTRLLNPYTPRLNPDLEAALKRAAGTLSPELAGADHPDDDLLAPAWPLDRERVDAETLDYVEDSAPRGYPPPFDSFIEDRRLVCRFMRLAYEEGETWLVEMLEQEREKVAAQAAYALALEKEAGLR